ncbi:MAG: GWxTD domain-containing protein [Bacteroidota bacterium]
MFRLLPLLAVLLAPAVFGQELPLDLNVDTATFYYDDDRALVEVYLAVGAASLTYKATENGFADAVEIQLALLPAQAGAPVGVGRAAVFADTLDLQFQVADTSALDPGQYFVQQVRAAIPPGEYELEVAVPASSADGGGDLLVRRDLMVPDFVTSGSVRLSDLTVSSSITRADEASDPTFTKNGLSIRPNPGRLFGEGLAQLYYYTEAYGLDAVLEGGTYTLLSYVAQANLPQPLEGLQRRTTRQVRSPDVLVGGFDVGDLPSGSYFLRLALLNADNEAVAEQSQKFFVFNPSVEAEQDVIASPAADDYMTTLYAAMPADELDANVEHAKVIATTRERNRLDQLSAEDAKREYLAEFWRDRDPNPSTAINEARRDFYERLLYAEDRYASGLQEGHESDRGRVLLRYGYPSGIDPYRASEGLRPYEIWEYDNIPGQGRSIFVFGDLDGFGRYEQIHSTVIGEESRPNWQQELRQ